MATADTDNTQTQTPPPAASDPNAVIQQYLQAILQGGGGGVTGPAAPATPAVNPNLPITSLLGEAFGGGVSPLYPMSEAQQTQAGNAALLNFGIGMLQNASGPVRHSLGQAVASGLLGAQGSLAGVREGQAQMLDIQNKQQQMELEKLKTALPLLTLQQQLNIARGLPTTLTGGGGAAPGGIAATGAPITGAPGGGAAPAFTGDLEKDRQIIAQRESGGDPTALNYVARADPTAYARGATASGKYQFVNSTWQEGMKLAGLDPSNYPTAMSAPEGVQDKVFDAVYGKYGTKPWDASTFKQNWVPTPTGQMILANVVPGGSKTATATPAAPTPPAPVARPTAAPGGGFGTSAFNAPATTVMPAPPGGGATAPNTTAEVPPVPTPQMTAARAVAVRTNRPAPIAGTDGLFVNPNGSVGPGPGGGGLGRRADISPIAQGMQTAQTTMPPTSAVAAGPAAGGAVTPAAVTPPPANAFGGGAFSGPAPAMIGTPPAPQPQAPTPPAPIAKPDGHPDTSLNTGPRVPDQPPPYARPPLTPEQQAVFSQKLPADQQAMFEQRYQQARQQAQITGDQAPVTAVQADYAKASQEWAQKAQTALAAFDTDQGKQQNDNWRTLWTAQNENDKAHRDVALDATKQLATSQIADNSKFMNANATALQHAYNVRDTISQVEPVLSQLPTGSASWLQNEQLVSWLEKVPGLSPAELQGLQNAPVFQQAMNRLATTLSPAELEGRQRPAMVNSFRDQLPTLSQSAEGRSLALAFVKQLTQRQIDTANWINQNKGNPQYINKQTGLPDYSLMLSDLEKPPVTNQDGTTSGGLGPMVRMPPLVKDARNPTAEEATALTKYRDSTPAGQPYFAPVKDPTSGKITWQYQVKPTGP